MIIGINGKIGVGKDLTGKIIQYLTLPTKHGPYIGFETFDDVTLERNSKFEVKKFAGKLKTIASLLTGVDVKDFEDQDFKQQQMPEGWDMTYRTFLQKLGTDAVRDGLHKDAWVNALFADYKSKRELLQADGTWIESDTGEVDFGVSIKYPKWIITDMRFPNEMEAVKERRGLTIRVVRQYSKEDLCKGSSPYIRDEELSAKLAKRYRSFESLPIVPPPHASETALDDAEFDYKIINDGSIYDLIEKVKQILITEKII